MGHKYNLFSHRGLLIHTFNDIDFKGTRCSVAWWIDKCVSDFRQSNSEELSNLMSLTGKICSSWVVNCCSRLPSDISCTAGVASSGNSLVLRTGYYWWYVVNCLMRILIIVMFWLIMYYSFSVRMLQHLYCTQVLFFCELKGRGN